MIALYIDGYRKPVTFSVGAAGITLGRVHSSLKRAYAHIPLDEYNAYDRGVSRLHVRIGGPFGEHFEIEDLNSTNGTFLNGKVLARGRLYPLRHGDELVLGALRMCVYFVPDSED